MVLLEAIQGTKICFVKRRKKRVNARTDRKKLDKKKRRPFVRLFFQEEVTCSRGQPSRYTGKVRWERG